MVADPNEVVGLLHKQRLTDQQIAEHMAEIRAAAKDPDEIAQMRARIHRHTNRAPLPWINILSAVCAFLFGLLVARL